MDHSLHSVRDFIQLAGAFIHLCNMHATFGTSNNGQTRACCIECFMITLGTQPWLWKLDSQGVGPIWGEGEWLLLKWLRVCENVNSSRIAHPKKILIIHNLCISIIMTGCEWYQLLADHYIADPRVLQVQAMCFPLFPMFELNIVSSHSTPLHLQGGPLSHSAKAT